VFLFAFLVVGSVFRWPLIWRNGWTTSAGVERRVFFLGVVLGFCSCLTFFLLVGLGGGIVADCGGWGTLGVGGM
jgi:hypothetical protein